MKKTKDITTISLLLASGVIIKYITDLFTRTFLFFLIIDPLILINVLIFLRYKKPSYLLSVMVVETVLSATLFMTTDFYLLRPVNVLITYLVCILFKNKSDKLILFLSTTFSIIVDVILSFCLFLFLPEITGVDTTSLMNVVKSIGETFSGKWLILVYGTSFILMSLWASIPGFINMFIGDKILKLFGKKGALNNEY